MDPRALLAFTVDYDIQAAYDSTLFPGVGTMLDDAGAAGWRLAVCTNKPLAATRTLLDALGVGSRFAAIGAGDSFPSRKPDPSHLLATIAAAHGRPERSVMVGDHRNDVAAARGARVPVIFAGWGYGDADMGEGAAAIAMSAAELLPLATGLLDQAQVRNDGGCSTPQRSRE